MASQAEIGEERRDQIVAFIEGFIVAHGHSPTVREVAAGVGLSSSGAAHRQLEFLVAEGRLKKVPVTSRTVAYAVPE